MEIRNRAEGFNLKEGNRCSIQRKLLRNTWPIYGIKFAKETCALPLVCLELNYLGGHLLYEASPRFIARYGGMIDVGTVLSLRTTLCVRFKSEVVACGVVYAAARRFQVPLPENPPWWKAFDADKSGINEVCRVLAHLYSLPKAKYIPVCKDGESFTTSNKSWNSPSQPVPKEGSLSDPPANTDAGTPNTALAATNLESGGSKCAIIKAALDKLKASEKSSDDSESVTIGVEAREEPVLKSKSEHRTEASGEWNKERDREKERDRDRDRDRDRKREKERLKVRERDRGRDSDWERERDDAERDRDKVKERGYCSKDKGKDSGRIRLSNGSIGLDFQSNRTINPTFDYNFCG